MIKSNNVDYDSDVRTHYFHWAIDENTATAAIADSNIYIPVPFDCRVVEIGSTTGLASGAGNSGSCTINFYRAGSATVASATTTSLLASGGFSISSGTTVGGISTATLNTSVITGPEGGMLVSAGTTLLININNTATSTVNFIRGYLKVSVDDVIVT